MNTIITLDNTTRKTLTALGVDAEGFCARAAAAHLRQCQDAAAILRVLDGPPQRPEERWACELSDREPAVRALALKGKP